MVLISEMYKVNQILLDRKTGRYYLIIKVNSPFISVRCLNSLEYEKIDYEVYATDFYDDLIVTKDNPWFRKLIGIKEK